MLAKQSQRMLVRYNSTSSLSDIFKRIDMITNKAQSAQKKIKEPKQKQTKQTKQVKQAAPKQPRVERIGVVSHPLMNSFGQNRPRWSQKPNNETEPKERAVRVRRNTPRPQQAAPAEPKQPTKAKATPRPTRTKNAAAPVNVPSKVLPPPEPLHVSVNGDTFLYGKIASINPCVTSRVASITKEALVSSKYPYMLPKHIIDQAPESADNKFLLQKNYSLDVDAEKLSLRFREVVQGKMEEIKVKEGPISNVTRDEIMKNGSLDVANRQLLFDAVNGVRSFREIFGDAAWNKK